MQINDINLGVMWFLHKSHALITEIWARTNLSILYWT